MIDSIIGDHGSSMWFVFVCIGLAMILLELILGIVTGLDLVFLGSAFVIGGLVTWPFHSWILTLITTMLICIAYIVLGRRYVNRWTSRQKEKTNVDTILGKKGIALQRIPPDECGLVKVGNEEWSARADESIEKDEAIIVADIGGVTLKVKKAKGEN
jgi:inner membrane protein